MNTTKTMRDLPPEERPYEKCIQYGTESLSDSELLAVILRSGTTGLSSLELARTILHEGTGNQGLLEIHHKTLQDLMRIRGIGQVKAIQIKCIGELSKRIASRAAQKAMDFRSPDSIADFYMEKLRHEEQEQVICMMLDTKNHFLGDKVISRGTVNAAPISPREILITALNYRAVYIIVIHNHPSGDSMPSDADVVLTKRLQEACDIVDIPLLDHIIIGDHTYFSFNEEGMLQ